MHFLLKKWKLFAWQKWMLLVLSTGQSSSKGFDVCYVEIDIQYLGLSVLFHYQYLGLSVLFHYPLKA